MRLAFRFRVIPFVATVALVVLGILLGNWQTRRAEEKLAVAARLAERGALAPLVLGSGGRLQEHERVDGVHPTFVEYRRVRLTGEWVSGWPLFLDNRPLNGRAGFVLAMPFKIAGSSQHVLVLRGWLPRDAQDYARVPGFQTPPGTVTIEGVATLSAGHLMQLGSAGKLEPGMRVQNLDIAAVASASGLALQPFFVQQAGAGQEEGLVREWPAPSLGVDKHRGYAFQWYALAAMAALFFVITGFRSGRKQAV
ncbi:MULTISPECIES: SURF1 family protein [unclassified Massilia]|uniref:SURF1 family protein n=1 Tax=unclassified Massilia TaxID=2609279 RepID=UPI00177D2824|nr:MULTISPECIES: SURF1 family protein [unclassified Massilia]MBD8529230.1 SURF1 family protein [Massilia sp. CFBP 13647]MBD8672624.1 SURF1 family protein [Massilia sp. CFBP 13721]